MESLMKNTRNQVNDDVFYQMVLEDLNLLYLRFFMQLHYYRALTAQRESRIRENIDLFYKTHSQ